MDNLNPKFVRRMFIASSVMMIIAVALSVFNTAQVLSAPLRTSTTVPQTVGFEGFLAESDGDPLDDGNYSITFRIYNVPTGGSAIWTEQLNAVQVTNGLYSVVLGANTVFTTNTFNGTRYIGITVGGGTEIIPRTHVSSVPFAINADNAQKIGGGGLEGMVVAFDGACPSGWTEFADARGRYIVGVPEYGDLGATVGTALSDKENRPVGQHTHTITDPGHYHRIWGTYGTNGSSNGNPGLGGDSGWEGPSEVKTTGITVNNAGSVAGTNAPYIQLRYCKLNS